MSRANGAVTSFLSLLIFTSLFSPKLLVFGSPIRDPSSKRPDPLRHFKNYNGSFTITNDHYWASAAFTGVPEYAVAGVWVLCGVCFGIYLACNWKSFSSGSSCHTNHFDRHYFLLLALVLLFTFLAMAASSCVLAANRISTQRIKRLKNTIVSAGEDAGHTLHKLNTAMTRIQYLLLPYDAKTCYKLNGTSHKLRREAQLLRAFIQNNEKSIDLAIQTLYISHLVVAILNLVLLATALVLLLWHWHPVLVIIIFLCWILTAVCWILTGADFFIESVAEDICSAFQDYVQNPQDNDLSSILPCMNSTASDKILSGIGFTVHNFITELNLKITKVCQTLGLNEQKDEWFPFAMICDPFSAATNYSYAPQKCTDNTIHIGDLPNILAGFTCYRQNFPGSCISSGKFLSEKEFRKASAYSYSIQTMLNVFPDLMSLTKCNVVKDSFTDIALNQCRPFRQSVRLLWVSMLCLSIFMMDLVLIWVVKAYLERGRSFNRCSIFPNRSNLRLANAH
ncbi:hypothetical protein SLA2020_205390 [Shorea laevis]